MRSMGCWKRIVAVILIAATTLLSVGIQVNTAYAAPSISGDDLLPSLTSSVVHVDEESRCISKISAGTTVEQFFSYLDYSEAVVVYKGNEVVSDDTPLGTGMLVRIIDGDAFIKTYTVIVTGDTSGDGKITITDMIAVKAHILKKDMLAGVYETAADVAGQTGGGDGKVTITDFIKVKAHILKKETITGVTAK